MTIKEPSCTGDSAWSGKPSAVWALRRNSARFTCPRSGQGNVRGQRVIPLRGASGRIAPFATGGYAYGINSNHGFDLGGGVNYWIRPKVGVRFEIRGTALKNLTILNMPGRFEPYAWTVDAGVGLNFGRR